MILGKDTRGKRMSRIIVCVGCGQRKEHMAKGLCGTCYNRQWRADNPEKVRLTNSRYYKKHSEKERERAHQYRLKNPDKVIDHNRKWYRDHREEILTRGGFWREVHPTYFRRWRQDNPEKVRFNTYRWHQENPGMRALYRTRRRALESAVSNTLTIDQVRCKFLIGHCFYCGSSEDLELDHFVPVSKNGGTTLGNTVIACRKCNSSKRAKLPQRILKQLFLPGLGL